MMTTTYNHAETIQKLERLNQLETVTAEQRIRIEKYRTMYETLKAEHDQVEDEKLKHNGELQQIKEEMKTLESECQCLVVQARNERDMKVSECEELKLKIFTPQKIEVLKIKVQEEIELPYKQKLEALEIDVDRYRNEFNRLRYDYAFLKSEYEHEVAQKKTVLDEVCARYELEKETMQKQLASLTEELNSKTPGHIHRLRQLQKENTQLNLQVKTLKGETEELRNKSEQANVETDQIYRLQARQLSELSIHVTSLESEKETAKLQLDRVQKELENSIREQDKLSSDLHKMERDNLQLKSQMEELIHSHKMELNNIKVNVTKDQYDLEQEKDHLQVEMNMYRSKVTIQESNILELKKDLEIKEQATIKRVQMVREEEWSKINKLESEKAQLESQISSLEQQKLDIRSSQKVIHDQLEDRLHAEQDIKEKNERDVSNLKNQLSNEKRKSSNFESEIEKLLGVKGEHQKLLQTHDHILSVEKEMKNELEKSQQSVQLLRKELDMSQGDLCKQREFHQKSLNEVKKQSERIKGEVDEKWNNLDKEYKELKGRYQRLRQNAKKKTKKMKSELEILSMQVEELRTKDSHHQLEKQNLMKNLSAEQERMRRKFDKFRHRQQQFSNVLNTSNFNALDNFHSDGRKNNSFLNPDEYLFKVPAGASPNTTAPQNSHDENHIPDM